MKPSNRYKERGKEEVKKRYCTNCGRLLEPKWKICPYCGVKIWKDIWKDKVTLEDEKMLIEREALSPSEPVPSVIIETKTLDDESLENNVSFSSIDIKDEKLKHDGLVQSQIEKKDINKPMKNLCPFCGYENELNKDFCYQCGYKLIK
jgi:RNA polymerase subunit RPABC4/transcription elongation factor Spt4